MSINIHEPCNSARGFYTQRRKTGITLHVYAHGMSTQKLGGLLRHHRTKEPKVTLEQLSKESRSLSVARISNYEQGIRTLKAREAKILAEAFGRLGKPITAAELLGISEETNAMEGGALTRHEMAIIEIYRQLPSSGRKRFLDHLYAFASAFGIKTKRVA